MVRVRISLLKSLYATPPRSPNPSHTPPYLKPTQPTHPHLIPLPSHSTQNPKCPSTISPTPNRFSSFQPPKFTQSPNLYLGSITFPLYNIQIPRTLNSRPFSSFFGSSGEPNKPPQVSNTSSPNGDEWVDHLKKVWQSAGDAAVYTGKKVQEASDQVTPYVHHLFEKYPYLHTVVIPVGWTLIGTMLAWMVMPRVLRKLHKYSTQGTAALLSGSLGKEQIPYDKSFWAALEDPVRYLVTFMAFSQLALLAPATIAPHYITQAWRGAVILSFVWFLHRWKASIFARALVNQSLVGAERENLLLLDKLSSVGLFVIGLMASAEACGVATQSVLTVGGIGGAATAFASKDILGNVLSGLSMQFSKPFSLGDTIKVGSIEGQVVEMGLTTTSLLNSEKFPLTVPNSLFSSQVIVNKSRAQWHGLLTTIPLRIANLEKIPQISEDIKSMLKSNTKVFLEKEAPYCFVARIESSYAELTIGCNLKKMSKDELYSTRQDILLQASRVIKHHGVELGSTQDPS